MDQRQPVTLQAWHVLSMLTFLALAGVGAWTHDRTVLVLAGIGFVFALVATIVHAQGGA